MTIEFNGKLSEFTRIQKQDGTNNTSGRIQKIKHAVVSKSDFAKKKITNKNIETAMNEPSSRKAIKGLLEKSPVGLTNIPNGDDLSSMGYQVSFTAYHIGAPVTYESYDGGRITVYNGKGSAEMGEDKKKVVYTNGRYTQEMYYDDNGNLTAGKIIIKDDVAGFTEEQYNFTVKDNNIDAIVK